MENNKDNSGDVKMSWQRAIEARRSPEQKRDDLEAEFLKAFTALSADGKDVTTLDLEKHLGVSRRTIYRRIKSIYGFSIVPQDDFYAPAFVRRDCEG